MSMTVTQIHDHFVGEISGLDLRDPVSSEDATRLNQALDRYGVLVFRGQHITDEQQLAFTQNFGKIELAVGGNVTKESERRLDIKLADVSNLDQNGKVMAKDDRRRMFNLGNRLWHSDSSYRAVPAKCSLLSCRSKPSKGGNTEFAFMPAAHDALDDETKAEIEDLVAVHSLIYSRGQLGFGDFTAEEKKTFAPVRQALVRANDFTGRKSIFLSAHIGTIVGWEMPEARDFIRELIEHATQPEFVHAHEWQVGDLVVWDNRQCMHRVRPFKDTDEPRDMRRTTVGGTEQTAEQAADQAA
ncbi:MAG: TauD/TfdA family dioxygenase [Alphaproteobacteria bacterium]|jgi:alpha-ketoglutarate-dependent 2,4-dichlorophenoxyacetate dioxygenase|nr:TauD/TfdA family dioxygenase [Alphaproteobacteria bacterium]